MKRIILLLFSLLLCFSIKVKAQSCSQNLDDARRAYYNGQFREVSQKLSNCITQLSKEEKSDALKLLVDTHLVLGEAQDADAYMAQFLENDPYYEVRESDLAEFKALYNTYTITASYGLGVSVGVLQPDYIIMRYQSAASETIEPRDYHELTGFSLGLSAYHNIWKELFVDVGLLWEYSAFKQEEIILGYQSVFSRERYHKLNVPIQLRYGYQIGKYKPYLGAGFATQFLLSAKAELDHSPIAPEFAKPSIGIPVEADNYDLSSQRKGVTGAWIFTGGIQRDFRGVGVELRFTYQYGINNLVDEGKREADPVLLNDFAYVPDDFRMDSYTFSVVIMKNYNKPLKK